MTPFIRLTKIDERPRVGITYEPITLGVVLIAQITPLKSGGSKVTQFNGHSVTVLQDESEILDKLSFTDLHTKAIPESDTGPAVPEGESEGDEPAETLDPADKASVASEAAIKHAEKLGIDIAAVPPNDKGRIGKPEVEKYFETLQEQA